MKVKLLVDLPINKDCGMLKGRIVEAREKVIKGRTLDRVKWTTTGDNGDRVGILGREGEVVLTHSPKE